MNLISEILLELCYQVMYIVDTVDLWDITPSTYVEQMNMEQLLKQKL